MNAPTPIGAITPAATVARPAPGHPDLAALLDEPRARRWYRRSALWAGVALLALTVSGIAWWQARQAASAVVMKSPIFTRSTGTPARRAASASPPAARIQLPARMRASTQVASAARPSHHATGVRNPASGSLANSSRADS